MPTFIPNSTTILSLFPIAMETTLNHNGWVVYRHPAVDKNAILRRTYTAEKLANSGPIPAGLPDFTDETLPCEVNRGYALIKVYDTLVWTRDFTQDSERYIPHPVTAHNVAMDLVASWAGHTLKGDQGSGPGIMICAGEEPTPEEIAAARASQTMYFRTLVNDGHSLHGKGQLKDISDLHRQAATWLGANNLPWLPKIEQVEMKKCVACGNEIRREALRCEHCSADLVDFYKKFQIEVDPNADPVVAALIARLSAPKSKVA